MTDAPNQTAETRFACDISMSANEAPNQTALWRSSLWDMPSNGTRHYVVRGEQYAKDERGGVWTGTREQAQRPAARLRERGVTHDH